MSYCGNNMLNRNLVDNTKILGTRYKCLRIGIQKGKNLPLDEDYLDPYEPIDKSKIYCGNSEFLPENYDRLGNLGDCLRKGIGVGKRQKALENRYEDGSDEDFEFVFNIKHTIIFFIIEISLFLFLFFSKPKFLLEKNKNKNVKDRKINFLKFFLFFAILSILNFLLIFITFKTII